MDIETWAYIRRLFFIEKWGKKAIARHLGMTPKTVRRAIAKKEFKSPLPYQPRSKLDPYKNHIMELLANYPQLSAVRIFEEIREKGYQGSLPLLRLYLQRTRIKRREAFLRIETLAGEQAQVDWACCGTIQTGNYHRKLSCFVMVLSYSRMLFLHFTLSQSLEDFLHAHLLAFRYFNGVPKRILYDNTPSVVASRRGREIRFNPRFLDFSSYYLFEPFPCNVKSPHEKGKVESGIKYVKGSFLAGREIKDFTSLVAEAVRWRDQVANLRIHGTTRKSPQQLYELEKPKLSPLPLKDYDTSLTRSCSSGGNCLVKFDSNCYSIPFKYAFQNLTLKADPHQVRIFHHDKLIATHSRSFDKYQIIENPSHYEGLLEIKSSARAFKIRDRFLSLGELAKDYLKGLVQAELNLNLQVAKILGLVNLYGKTEVLQAMEHALTFRAFGYEYIHNIIWQQRKARGLKQPTGPVSSKQRPELMNTIIEERDLNLYDQLFLGDSK